jgi:hypothetical protein
VAWIENLVFNLMHAIGRIGHRRGRECLGPVGGLARGGRDARGDTVGCSSLVDQDRREMDRVGT